VSGGTGLPLAGAVTKAAPALLGCRLGTSLDGEVTEVIITEVEAYGGADDPASHAFGGPTPRNGSMFGPPGTLYVYRAYGIHWCLNVVTGPEGHPAAVLVRAGTPVTGIRVMERRRGRTDHLADGPGKLAQALGVTGDHDGSSVFDGPVRLAAGDPPSGEVVATPRIGIGQAVDRPWRFVGVGPVRG
jgi:DNA-3-methyladenine glycosylase